MRKSLIAGNWKMNGQLEDSEARVSAILSKLKTIKCDADILICPPFTLLSNLVTLTKGANIKIGAQDCHYEEKGAHTGDISPNMIKDLSAEYVILGHSERRANHNETDQIVSLKVKNAINAGLKPIVCVGETKEEKEQGKTLNVIQHQLKNSLPKDINLDDVVIAYEPIWAIGTGLVPSLNDISEVHSFIRNELGKIASIDYQKTRILYGGSLNAKNAKEILAIDNVDGGLIGGASLNADDFFNIITSL